MRDYDPDKGLVSIHVPKSGGTTLLNVLQLWFGENLVEHYPPRTTVAPPLKAGLCVHGHFNFDRGFGVPHVYPDAEQFITVLRDPFDNLVSGYSHARRARPNGEWVLPEVAKKTFAEFVLGTRDARNGSRRPRPCGFFPYPDDAGERLAAGTLFDPFVAVGVTEQLDDTIRVLAYRLGKPLPALVPRLNIARSEVEGAEQWRAAYKASFPEDYRVYDEAKRRLDAGVARIEGESR